MSLDLYVILMGFRFGAQEKDLCSLSNEHFDRDRCST